MSGRRSKPRKPPTKNNIFLFKRSYMLVNFSQVLKDSEGENLQLDANSPALTLKEISKLAIKAVLQDDQNMAHSEKLDWARLGEVIAKSGDEPVNVDSAKMSKLKERICRVFPAISVAYAVELAIEGTV